MMADRRNEAPRKRKSSSPSKSVTKSVRDDPQRVRGPLSFEEMMPRETQHDERGYSSSSGSSYVDISRTFPIKSRLGIGAIREFFTAPSERRHRPRRVKSRRLLKLSNSSSSSINTDLAYGSGYLRRRRGEVKGKGKERDTGYGSGSKHKPGSDAAILEVGAGLAALARKQNRLHLSDSRRSNTFPLSNNSPSSREERSFFNRGESSRGIGPSKGKHTVDEDGWESATDEESDVSSVDSKLAYDDATTSGGWGWGKPKPRRQSSVVDPNLFGPLNSLHGVITTPVGFREVDINAPGGFIPPPSPRRSPSDFYKEDTTVSTEGPLRHVYPIPTSDPGRFDATRSSAISEHERPYSVSRPNPVPLQQPQPYAPISQSVYEPAAVYSSRSEPLISRSDVSSARRTKSVAGAALAGVAGAAIGAAIVSDRRDSRDPRGSQDPGDERQEERRHRRREDPRDDASTVSREKRRERRREDDREDPEEARREKRRERRREEGRIDSKDDQREQLREKRRDEPREERADDRRERRREERRSERPDESYVNQPLKDPVAPTQPFPIDPFQFQVPDDAFETPNLGQSPKIVSFDRPRTPAVVTVERVPSFARGRSSSTREEVGESSSSWRQADEEQRDRKRIEDEAEKIYQETEHFTAPIEVAAIGAAVAAVVADESRHSRGKFKKGVRQSYENSSEKERDAIQEEADRVYREAVLARKIASSHEEGDVTPRISTPPGMEDHKKVGPYDAPNADFKLDHEMDPVELKLFTPIATRSYPSNHDFSPTMDKPFDPASLGLARPLLNLVRPTPAPTPVPELQIARSKPKTSPKESAQESPKPKETTNTVESTQNIRDSPEQDGQTTTTGNGWKSVTWGENETKHYEVESPSEHRDELITDAERDRAIQAQTKPPVNKKPSHWGAIRDAFAIGSAGVAVSTVASALKDGSSTTERKQAKQEIKETPIERSDYRGVVVESATPLSSQILEDRGPPPVGPKPPSPSPSPRSSTHIPGAFDDDIDFTATVAAGLEDSGFDPDIVINDPTFRRRTSPGSSPPGTYRPAFAETVSDLGAYPVESTIYGETPRYHGLIIDQQSDTHVDDAGVIPEDDGEFTVKLTKKELRKREKAAQKQDSENKDVSSIYETPVSSQLVEEPESYFEPKSSKKDKKKSKKARKESSGFDDEPDDLDKDATVTIPMDAFDDLPDAPTAEEWDVPKKSKKKSKRDSERFDSPSQSVAGSELNDEIRDSSKKSKDKSRRKSGQFDEDAEAPDNKDEDRKSRKSSKRDSINYDTQSVVSNTTSKYDDEEDSKKSKKKEKKNGGFFGLFGSSTSKSDPETEQPRGDSPKSHHDDDFEEPKKKSKKSKRSSMGDSSELYGNIGSQSVTDISYNSSATNGNGHENNDVDEGDTKKSRKKDKKRGKSADETSEKESFLVKAGTLGAGVGLAGAAAVLAARHLQSKADNVDSKERQLDDHFPLESQPPQSVFDHGQDFVDPEISQRQFRPSIDPQYGDLLPLPPSDPGSPNVKPIVDLPSLPESRPGSPKSPMMEHFTPRDKAPGKMRKIEHTPMKSPSVSAVPLKFKMGSRSIPASSGAPRGSPLTSPVVGSPDTLGFTKPRARPTSWDNTKEYQPLFLVSHSRTGSQSQPPDVDNPFQGSISEALFIDTKNAPGTDHDSTNYKLDTADVFALADSSETEQTTKAMDTELSEDLTLPTSTVMAGAGLGLAASAFTAALSHKETESLVEKHAIVDLPEPPQVESDTKNRSSYLFQSSPASSQTRHVSVESLQQDQSADTKSWDTADITRNITYDPLEADISAILRPSTTTIHQDTADEAYFTPSKKSKKNSKKNRQELSSTKSTADDPFSEIVAPQDNISQDLEIAQQTPLPIESDADVSDKLPETPDFATISDEHNTAQNQSELPSDGACQETLSVKKPKKSKVLSRKASKANSSVSSPSQELLPESDSQVVTSREVAETVAETTATSVEPTIDDAPQDTVTLDQSAHGDNKLEPLNTESLENNEKLQLETSSAWDADLPSIVQLIEEPISFSNDIANVEDTQVPWSTYPEDKVAAQKPRTLSEETKDDADVLEKPLADEDSDSDWSKPKRPQKGKKEDTEFAAKSSGQATEIFEDTIDNSWESSVARTALWSESAAAENVQVLGHSQNEDVPRDQDISLAALSTTLDGPLDEHVVEPLVKKSKSDKKKSKRASQAWETSVHEEAQQPVEEQAETQDVEDATEDLSFTAPLSKKDKKKAKKTVKTRELDDSEPTSESVVEPTIENQAIEESTVEEPAAQIDDFVFTTPTSKKDKKKSKKAVKTWEVDTSEPASEPAPESVVESAIEEPVEQTEDFTFTAPTSKKDKKKSKKALMARELDTSEQASESKAEPTIEEPTIGEPTIEEQAVEERAEQTEDFTFTAPMSKKDKKKSKKALMTWEADASEQISKSNAEPVIEEPVIEEPVIEEPAIEEPAIQERAEQTEDFTFTPTSKKDKKKSKKALKTRELDTSEPTSESMVESALEEPAEQIEDFAFTTPTTKKDKKKSKKAMQTWDEDEMKDPIPASVEALAVAVETGAEFAFTSPISKKEKKKSKKAAQAWDETTEPEATPIDKQFNEDIDDSAFSIPTSKKGKKAQKNTSDPWKEEPITVQEEVVEHVDDFTFSEPKSKKGKKQKQKSKVLDVDPEKSTATVGEVAVGTNIYPAVGESLATAQQISLEVDNSAHLPTAVLAHDLDNISIGGPESMLTGPQPGFESAQSKIPEVDGAGRDQLSESLTMPGNLKEEVAQTIASGVHLPVATSDDDVPNAHLVEGHKSLESTPVSSQETANDDRMPGQGKSDSEDFASSSAVLPLTGLEAEVENLSDSKEHRHKKHTSRDYDHQSPLPHEKAVELENVEIEETSSANLARPESSSNVPVPAISAIPTGYNADQLEIARQMKADFESGAKKSKKGKKGRQALSRTSTEGDSWSDQVEVPAGQDIIPHEDIPDNGKDLVEGAAEVQPIDGLTAGYKEEQLSLAKQLQAEFDSGNKKSKKGKKSRSTSRTPNLEYESPSSYFDQSQSFESEQNKETTTGIAPEGENVVTSLPDGFAAGYNAEQLELARQMREEFGAGSNSKKSKKDKKRQSMLRSITDESSTSHFDGAPEDIPLPSSEFDSAVDSMPLDDPDMFLPGKRKSKKDQKRQTLLRTTNDDNVTNSDDATRNATRDASLQDEGTGSTVDLIQSPSNEPEEFAFVSKKSKKDKKRQSQVLQSDGTPKIESSQDSRLETGLEPDIEPVVVVPEDPEEFASIKKKSKKDKKRGNLLQSTTDEASPAVIDEVSQDATLSSIGNDSAEVSSQLISNEHEEFSFNMKKNKKDKKKRQNLLQSSAPEEDEALIDRTRDSSRDPEPLQRLSEFQAADFASDSPTAEPEEDFSFPTKSKKDKKDKKMRKSLATVTPEKDDLTDQVTASSQDTGPPQLLSAIATLEPGSVIQAPVTEVAEPEEDFPFPTKKSKKDKKIQHSFATSFPKEDISANLVTASSKDIGSPELLSAEATMESHELKESPDAEPKEDFGLSTKKSKKDKKDKKMRQSLATSNLEKDALTDQVATSSQDTDQADLPSVVANMEPESAVDTPVVQPDEDFEFSAKKSKKDKKKRQSTVVSTPKNDTSTEQGLMMSQDIGLTELLSSAAPIEPENTTEVPVTEPEEDFGVSTKKSKKDKKKRQSLAISTPENDTFTDQAITSQNIEPTELLPGAAVEEFGSASEFPIAEPEEDFGFSTKKSKKDKKKRQSLATSTPEIETSTDEVATIQEAELAELPSIIAPLEENASEEPVADPEEDFGFSTKKSKKDKKKRQNQPDSTPGDETSTDQMTTSSQDIDSIQLLSGAAPIAENASEVLVAEPEDDFSFSTKKSKKDKKEKKKRQNQSDSTPENETSSDQVTTSSQDIDPAELLSSKEAPVEENESEVPVEKPEDEFEFSTKKGKKDKKKRQNQANSTPENETSSDQVTTSSQDIDPAEVLSSKVSPLGEIPPEVPFAEPEEDFGFPIKKTKKDKKKRQSLTNPASDNQGTTNQTRDLFEDPGLVETHPDTSSALDTPILEPENDLSVSTKKSKKGKGKDKRNSLSQSTNDDDASQRQSNTDLTDVMKTGEDLKESNVRDSKNQESISDNPPSRELLIGEAPVLEAPIPLNNTDEAPMSWADEVADEELNISNAPILTDKISFDDPQVDPGQLDDDLFPVTSKKGKKKGKSKVDNSNRRPISGSSGASLTKPKLDDVEGTGHKEDGSSPPFGALATGAALAGAALLSKGSREITKESSDSGNQISSTPASVKKSKKKGKAKIVDRRSTSDDLFDDPVLWEGAEPQQFEEVGEKNEIIISDDFMDNPREDEASHDSAKNFQVEATKDLPTENETSILDEPISVPVGDKVSPLLKATTSADANSSPPPQVAKNSSSMDGPNVRSFQSEQLRQQWNNIPEDLVRSSSKKGGKIEKIQLAAWDAPKEVEVAKEASRDIPIEVLEHEDILDPTNTKRLLGEDAVGKDANVFALAASIDEHIPDARKAAKIINDKVHDSQDRELHWNPPRTSLPVVFEEESLDNRKPPVERRLFTSTQEDEDGNRDSALVTESPVPPHRRLGDDHEYSRDSGVHLREWTDPETPTVRAKSHAASTDEALSKLSWPVVDDETETVDLDRSQRFKDGQHSIYPVQSLAAGALGVAAEVAKKHDKDYRIGSPRLGRNTPDLKGLHTPEHSHIRPGSAQSNLSSGTPPLRRSDRKLSGDLRSLSQRSQPNLAKAAREAVSPATSIINDSNPIANEGRVRAKDMADVYDGYGEGRIASPMSPTRPHSMRRRQSMQVLDLEARLEQLAAENRMLAEAKFEAERSLRGSQQASGALAEREAEINNLKQALDFLHTEVSRLKEINDGLTSANRTLGQQHDERYGSLESRHAQTTRELEDAQHAQNNLSGGLEAIVRNEVTNAVRDKDKEIAQLLEELEAAKLQIREMQRQILASKSNDVEFLTIRDEDYFDNACQQLCQHVQQWVLRFSKFSDMRACRLTSEINNDKIIDRLDNAVLDGSDVDAYLSNRVTRRDIFMSMTMTMVWEFVFTRYLFGMDREQRQKLKSLEKLLAEVGPPAAVHQWRATTLTLLSKRRAFVDQREQDTEAVVQEIFQTLSEILPPPTQLEEQIQEQLRRVMKVAIDLSIEMRTQRAEYMMLPPLQPEYDANGDLARQVQFNAALMNERSGGVASNEELEAQKAVVKVVLFPLVVKKGDDAGNGDEEIVVCPAQVLIVKPKKAGRIFSGDSMMHNNSHVSMQSSMPMERVDDI